MNLKNLVAAVNEITDGVRADGPHLTYGATRQGAWEVVFHERFGDGVDVTVTDDGVARYTVMQHAVQMKVRKVRLPRDVEAAAEKVVSLVWRA